MIRRTEKLAMSATDIPMFLVVTVLSTFRDTGCQLSWLL